MAAQTAELRPLIDILEVSAQVGAHWCFCMVSQVGGQGMAVGYASEAKGLMSTLGDEWTSSG
jgi:hypothetical protein